MRLRLALVLLCVLCGFCLAGDARQERVTVTAYSAVESRGLTASGLRPRPGMLALSRDLERALGVAFGDTVTLGGVPYVFEDRMNKKWRKRVDIFSPSYRQAKQFGIKHQVLLRLDAPYEARATQPN